MADLDIDTVLGWRGKTVLDQDGDKIGTFGDVYLDRATNRPGWGGVKTGLFGTRESYVPLDQVTVTGDDLQLPYDKDLVTGAPRIDPDVALSAAEEERLYSHYGRAYEPGPEPEEEPERPEEPPPEGRPPAGGGAVAAGRAPAAEEGQGPRAEDEGGEGSPADGMIRSEEEVRIGRTAPRPVERVRLKKVLVTDYVKRKVPVRKEEIRLEQDPPRDEPPSS